MRHPLLPGPSVRLFLPVVLLSLFLWLIFFQSSFHLPPPIFNQRMAAPVHCTIPTAGNANSATMTSISAHEHRSSASWRRWHNFAASIHCGFIASRAVSFIVFCVLHLNCHPFSPSLIITSTGPEVNRKTGILDEKRQSAATA